MVNTSSCDNVDRTLFTRTVDGKVVSRASIQFRGRGWCSLEEVITLKQYRGQGFARSVCREALDWCFNQGFHCWLMAAPIFEDALNVEQLVKFYESLGFTVIESESNADRVFMEYLNPDKGII